MEREHQPSYEELQRCLEAAESTSKAIREGQADTVLGDDHPLAARLAEAEQAARQSEENLRTTLDSIGDAVITTDVQGRITRMNPVGAALTGWTFEEAANRPLEEVFHVVDARTGDKALNPAARVLEEGAVVGLGNHTLLISKSGTEYQIADSAAPVRSEDGSIRGVVLVFRDVTEHYRMQKALEASESRFRELFRNMSSCVAVYQPVDDGNDFEFLDFNAAAEKADKLNREDLIGKKVTDVFPAVKTFGLLDVFKRVWKTGIPESHPVSRYRDSRIVGWRENYVYKLSSGEIVALYEDATERKQAEEMLAANYTLLRIAGETVKFGGWSVDLKSKICTWSETVSDIHEMPRGCSPSLQDGIRFYAPEWRDRITQVFTDCAEKGIPYNEEMEIITRTGRRVWVLTAGEPVRDSRGNIVKVQGSFQDITERKQDEVEKQRLQAQLMQAQKMESVGRLAGGIAHDFNNMLSIILGYGENLLAQLPVDNPMREQVREIIGAASRSAALTRQLLAFSRKQVISPRVLDLNETVENMLKMVRRLIGEDIHLAWVPGHGLWSVHMDPTQIDQILANLAVNARDAITGAGEVTIRTQNIVLDKVFRAEHPGSTPGDHVMLTVRDNGCGMDKETLANAFEPFFTTKEVGKGTGMGLPTVYGIVKQNNGVIQVESQPGKGTVISIYLPRAQSEAVKEEETGPDELPRGRGEMILLVEDEPVVLEMAKIMLERFGYGVLPADTPQAAIRLAQEKEVEIHLLMTDVVLPRMNGQELAGRLREIRPNLRCLFMSGYTADLIARQGVLDEGGRFIEKPFTLETLARKVREALEG